MSGRRTHKSVPYTTPPEGLRLPFPAEEVTFEYGGKEIVVEVEYVVRGTEEINTEEGAK